MPIRSDDPLRKVTFNIYEEDYRWLIANYGPGWTERLRQHIHNLVHDRQRWQPKRTIGDLLND